MQRFATTTLLFISFFSVSGAAEPVVPVFKDGEAQIVDGFKDPDFWLRHDLWVETEFDSDDGKLDRMHVSVTRPRQTPLSEIARDLCFESLFRGHWLNSGGTFLGPQTGTWYRTT